MKIYAIILVLLMQVLFVSCTIKRPLAPPLYSNVSFAAEMRIFITNIASYARSYKSSFVVIPQNGEGLLTNEALYKEEYLSAISAQAREDVFYGYPSDDKESDTDFTQNVLSALSVCRQNGLSVLLTDYCKSEGNVKRSYQTNKSLSFLSFQAPERDLNVIPNAAPNDVNNADIYSLKDAKNFLYIINTEEYETKNAFLSALSKTDYDVIIMDLFYEGDVILTAADVSSLRYKKSGGRRLLISYMSIGEAEDYRYYWDESFEDKDGAPSWLGSENPEWDGNYKVYYWLSQWQSIIYGNESSYLKKIIDRGFDGVYLDIVDAYEYFSDIYE